MNWRRVLQQQGWQVADNGTDVDPFSLMAAQDSQTKARLSVGVKAGDYGEVFVNVSIECPQSEAYINLAGECAFRKAVELANDGARMIGVAGLPIPPKE
jgi:hypothetical protein